MLDYLIGLKNFLADRPEFAFLSLSLAVNAYLFRLLMKERDRHVETLERWLPMVQRLSEMLSTAAKKARRPPS